MGFVGKEWTILIVLTASCVLGGCGNESSSGSMGPLANGSTVQTANAWFHAINARNRSEVVSFFSTP